MVAHFAVEYVYTADTEKRDEVRPAHRAFLAELQEKGQLLASGPWTTGTGALLIFEIDSEEALTAVLEHDPFADADLISRVRITEWTPVLGAWVAAG